MQEVFIVMNLEKLKGKTVHFIGIGGVSMSGIAKCFHENGAHVQGSDASLQDSKYLEGFAEMGIKLFQTHQTQNITPNIDFIVKTSTVPESNPEIVQANTLKIPIIERYEALEIILATFKTRIGVSGSSGKTTTTALIWQALCEASKIKHSCIIGTILNEFQSTVFVNRKSEICVIEADESDGSFALMNFNIAVITDIEKDHLEHHRYHNSQQALIDHFRIFVSKTLNSGGMVIYNSACETTCKLMDEFTDSFSGKIFSYSGIETLTTASAFRKGDCFLTDAKNTQSGIVFSCDGITKQQNISIPMIGTINAFNALPSLIITQILYKQIPNGIFNSFKGLNKRAEIVGQTKHFAVIDDYAHSPKKIRMFIESFAQHCKSIDAKFVIICEPHKYTRVASHYSEYIACFNATDNLIMMEIFGIQGGNYIQDISSQKLTDDIEKHWQKTKKHNFFIKSLQNNNSIINRDTFNFIEEFQNTKQFVFFVFLGAGYSNKYAHLFWNSMKNCYATNA